MGIDREVRQDLPVVMVNPVNDLDKALRILKNRCVRDRSLKILKLRRQNPGKGARRKAKSSRARMRDIKNAKRKGRRW